MEAMPEQIIIVKGNYSPWNAGCTLVKDPRNKMYKTFKDCVFGISAARVQAGLIRKEIEPHTGKRVI